MTIVDRINVEYKESRRVSLDCELFSFVKQSADEILTKQFSGIILDSEKIGENEYEYVVYIEELVRMFNVKNNNLFDIFTNVICKMIVFDERQTLRDKVKVIIL